MIGAFAIGIALQAAVTEISPLIGLFGTVRLNLTEWLQLMALSATPLIVHELFVIVNGKKHETNIGAEKIMTELPREDVGAAS